MKTIGAAKFEERCLDLLDELDDDGLVIAKRGKPVARRRDVRANRSVLRYPGGHRSLAPFQTSRRPSPSRRQLPDQRPGWRWPSSVT